MSETPTRAQLEAELAERAHTDAAFRAQLTTDPTATIRRELAERGITLSDSATVYLHEETPTALHLVLPAPVYDEAELDDAALDLIAGGSGEGDVLCLENNVGC